MIFQYKVDILFEALMENIEKQSLVLVGVSRTWEQLIIEPKYHVRTKSCSDFSKVNVLLTVFVLRLAAKELCSHSKYDFRRFQFFTSPKFFPFSIQVVQGTTSLTYDMEDSILLFLLFVWNCLGGSRAEIDPLKNFAGLIIIQL